MHATYNITNDRIKFYPPPERLTPEQDSHRKAHNFQLWPGQKCFSAVWSPQAEDWVKTFCEINEDDTPDDVEARIERYQKYADRDERDAAGATERAINATTDRRARMAEASAARKLDEALYWQRRIYGAISHAANKDRPDVIARRVKKLEADKRRHERNRKESEIMLIEWEKVTDYASALNTANWDPHHFTGCFPKSKYPNSTYEGEQSIWSALEKHTIDETDAKRLAINSHTVRVEYNTRWIDHLEMRLQYERAYCEAVGGAELMQPKPRRTTPAPEDGLKKGDKVEYKVLIGGSLQTWTGNIVSLGPKSCSVTIPEDQPMACHFPKGYKVARRYCKKIESI